MTTQAEKKFVINYQLMKYVSGNDVSYLSEVLAEISSSDEMVALSIRINSGRKDICDKIMDVLDNESSEVIDSLYDFVKLI